jgi:hypothetical protein
LIRAQLLPSCWFTVIHRPVIIDHRDRTDQRERPDLLYWDPG